MATPVGQRRLRAPIASNNRRLSDIWCPTTLTQRSPRANFYYKQKCTQLLNFASFLHLTRHNDIRNPQLNAQDICFWDIERVRVARGEFLVVPQDTNHPGLVQVL